MSPEIDQLLHDAVDSGAVPQVVAMAADRDGVVYQGAAGPRVAGQDGPDNQVGPDTVFRIASMTKMVVTAAALRLVEQEALDLDAPVERYLPEFADKQVLVGFDGDAPVLRPPAGQSTVRHLVTHTSGLGYWFFNADLVAWEAATGSPNALAGQDSYLAAPLVADPGTRFEYGINIDWLGRVLERASGTKLDDLLAGEILGPLGMTSTGFRARPEDAGRTVPIHLRGEDGGWVPSPIELSQAPEHWPGGHGLYSTPRDYLAFQRMLLGGGVLDGVRVLHEQTVDDAFRNQIGELDFPAEIRSADPAATADFAAGPGHKWGYGLMLNTERADGLRAAGSGTWSGLFNTHFWVDPGSGLTGAIYSQFLPFVEGPSLALYRDFERALYATR
jgi:methyl acetate hydrolase